MDQTLDLHTVVLAVGFVLLVGMSAWHRLRLERTVAALPEEVREQLGWIKPESVSPRGHRRLVARRLLVRGLPGWVPLDAAGRRDLFWYRAFGFGAGVWLIGALPIAWGVWILLPMLGLPLAAMVAIYALIDGPWGEPD